MQYHPITLKIVFAQSNTNTHQPSNRTSVTRIVRPLPREAVAGFAQWVQHEPWTFVYDGTSVSDMVDRFNFLAQPKYSELQIWMVKFVPLQ